MAGILKPDSLFCAYCGGLYRQKLILRFDPDPNIHDASLS